MNTAQKLTPVGMALRVAVEQGRFADAQALLVQYREELEQLLKETVGAERDRVFCRAMETLEWGRKCALAGRSHAARYLMHIRATAPYVAAPAAHTWRIEG